MTTLWNRPKSDRTSFCVCSLKSASLFIIVNSAGTKASGTPKIRGINSGASLDLEFRHSWMSWVGVLILREFAIPISYVRISRSGSLPTRAMTLTATQPIFLTGCRQRKESQRHVSQLVASERENCTVLIVFNGPTSRELRKSCHNTQWFTAKHLEIKAGPKVGAPGRKHLIFQVD